METLLTKKIEDKLIHTCWERQGESFNVYVGIDINTKELGLGFYMDVEGRYFHLDTQLKKFWDFAMLNKSIYYDGLEYAPILVTIENRTDCYKCLLELL